jgi:hypothetical protein
MDKQKRESETKNHWMRRPWSSHRPDGGWEPFGNTAIDIKVATLVMMLPKVAKNTKRLIAVYD